MIPWITTFFTALLWDQSAFQRYFAGGCIFLGSILNHGGSLSYPGGTVVIPGLADVFWLGPILQAIGGFVAVDSLPKPIQAANVAAKEKQP